MKQLRRFCALALGTFLLPGCVLQHLYLLNPEAVAHVHCLSAELCLEDSQQNSQRQAKVEALYREAHAFVQSLPGGLQTKPRVVFCTTQDCFQAFGFGHSAASTVGALGIVVSPRGWQDYYLRHEMIHVMQYQELGLWGQTNVPAWFREGMAYAWSQDPRPELAEPFQTYRQRFLHWVQGIEPEQFWDAAAVLAKP